MRLTKRNSFLDIVGINSCHNCGSKDITYDEWDNTERITCNDCGFSTGWRFKSSNEAKNTWNNAGFYRFPECSPENNKAKQLAHVCSESNEAICSYISDNDHSTIMEIMDTIHCAETALRMYGLSDEELEEYRNKVIAKNEARGYYSNN